MTDTGDIGIFFEADGGLELMREAPYDSEDVLQQALARYPEVIAGINTSSEDTARLALIRREMAVPADEGGTGVWSLDHMFVDAESIPVFVEVKRSSDTRIRREVVGQMLDYAANGMRYWPEDSLRAAFETEHEDPDAELAQRLGVEAPDLFWRNAERNLREGRVRLLFVADRLPDRLVTIIEFLNEHLNEAEVLGIELAQFVGVDGGRAFVPKVVGRTSRAVAVKGEAGTHWTRESFLQAADALDDAPQTRLVRRLLDHVDENGGELTFGNGKTPGLTGRYPIMGTSQPVFILNLGDGDKRRARVGMYAKELAAFIGQERTDEGLAILARINAFSDPVRETRDDDYQRWPMAPLGEFADRPEDVRHLLDALESVALQSPGNQPT